MNLSPQLSLEIAEKIPNKTPNITAIKIAAENPENLPKITAKEGLKSEGQPLEEALETEDLDDPDFNPDHSSPPKRYSISLL